MNDGVEGFLLLGELPPRVIAETEHGPMWQVGAKLWLHVDSGLVSSHPEQTLAWLEQLRERAGTDD